MLRTGVPGGASGFLAVSGSLGGLPLRHASQLFFAELQLANTSERTYLIAKEIFLLALILGSGCLLLRIGATKTPARAKTQKGSGHRQCDAIVNLIKGEKSVVWKGLASACTSHPQTLPWKKKCDQ